MEKNLHLFYSDLLRKGGNLTSNQADILQQMFFPGWAEDDENTRAMDSLRDFSRAYHQWDAEQQAATKKTEDKKPLSPMTEAELDAIADMF